MEMTQDLLLKTISEVGIDKIRFLAPFKTQGTGTPLGLMVSSDGPEEIMECKIVEDQHKISDRYKISLTPADRQWYTEHYYLLDFCSLIERGVVKIKEVCTCGNPEMGFDCVCGFVKDNPGTHVYTCEFCGLYTAGKPRCNKCEED